MKVKKLKKLKKKPNNKRKGNKFERTICSMLSLWWTKGERDDVFCRSASSGARATQRSKKDKKTANQYGDISLSDPVGEQLLKTFVFELKKGYNKSTVQDLLDKGNSDYKKWIDHAKECASQAGSKSWMVIHGRDRRSTVCIMPLRIMESLISTCRIPVAVACDTDVTEAICCFPLQMFFDCVSPETVVSYRSLT